MQKLWASTAPDALRPTVHEASSGHGTETALREAGNETDLELKGRDAHYQAASPRASVSSSVTRIILPTFCCVAGLSGIKPRKHLPQCQAHIRHWLNGGNYFTLC